MSEPGRLAVEPCLLCVEPDASTRAELRDALQAHLSDLDPVVDVCESLTAAETVLVLDPSVHDERTVSTLQEVCDGWLEVRAAPDGTDQLRIRGLSNQPEGWTHFSVPE